MAKIMLLVASFLLLGVGVILVVFLGSRILPSPASRLSTPEPSPVPIFQASESSILAATATATPSPIKRTKNLKIALLGDSMIQTMGKLKPLKDFLEESSPDLLVEIINLGMGATTIEDGLKRLPEVIDKKPNIVVVESFAYNHLSKDGVGLLRHREVLGQIVSGLQANGISKVVILVTIAPLELYAYDASESAGWSVSFRKEEANWIKRYLENTTVFANSQGLPLVDTYHKTLGVNGYGDAFYVNPTDDIHPNENGQALVSRLIAEKIINLGWLSKN